MRGRNFGSHILRALKELKAPRLAWLPTLVSFVALFVTVTHLYLQFLHRPNKLIVVAEPFAFKASFDTLFVPLTFVNNGRKTNNVLSTMLFQTSEESIDSGRIIADGVTKRKASFVIAPGEMMKLELLSPMTTDGKRYVWLGFVTITEDGHKTEQAYIIGFYTNPKKGFRKSGYILDLLKTRQTAIKLKGILDRPVRL